MNHKMSDVVSCGDHVHHTPHTGLAHDMPVISMSVVNKTPMKDLVRFIAITTDPKRDTPRVLQDYGPAHGLESANWTFLTDGQDKPETTRNLAESYGLKFTPTKDGYQMHGLVTHLIDESGNLRGRYHGLKFSATNMVLHINALTNDIH